MPNILSDLTVREISLVDRPANSSTVEGKRVPRARVALWKRDSEEDEELQKAVDGKTQDGVSFPKSDFAYTPDDVPSHWKLRLTKTPGGPTDPGIVGAAVAALGKGFHGNVIKIPASALAGVKAKVRAAWRSANKDKDASEMPDVLKSSQGEEQEMPMTLEDITEKVEGQEVILKALTSDNDILKAENEAVMKMTKKERKVYSSMDDDTRKQYVAGDLTKRKSMMDDATLKRKKKKMTDDMDEATKAEFLAAGPEKQAVMMAKIEEVQKQAELSQAEDIRKAQEILRKAKAKPGEDDEEEETPEEEDKEEEMAKHLEANTALALKVAETTDRVVKAESELAVMRKRDRLVQFTKRAEAELPHTAGTPEEKGTLLMSLADSLPGGENGETFMKTMESLKTADKALSLHFGEVGKSGGSIPAEKALDAKVEEISKRDKIDRPHAMMKAMQEAPELYMDYERQHRQFAVQQ